MENDRLESMDFKGLEKEVDKLYSNEERKKLFVEVLTLSVLETSTLMNMITLILENPEIVRDVESRKKLNETLVVHKRQMSVLAEKIKKL